MSMKKIQRPPTPIHLSNFSKEEEKNENYILLSDLYIERSKIFLKMGYTSEALNDSNEAIKLSPSNKKAILQQHKTHNILKDYDSIYIDFLTFPYLREFYPNNYKLSIEYNDKVTNLINKLSEIKIQFNEPKKDSYIPIISREKAIEITNKLKKIQLLELNEVITILNQIKTLHQDLPNIVKINDIDPSIEYRIVGDTHGQFQDLIYIFEHYGYPSSKTPYIFNGDYVDRGSMGVEILIVLFSWKIAEPNSIFLNRGNQYIFFNFLNIKY